MKLSTGGMRHLFARAAVTASLSYTSAVQAEEIARPIAPFVQVPKGPASFFVTSRGLNGGDLNGLAGADAHCQKLAREAGLEITAWRAYLSTQASPTRPAVNARDRIGQGPWFNVQGVRIAETLAHLHGDTLDYARAGNLISQADALTERGDRVAGENEPNMRHDILTGSTPDRRAFDDRYDRTCRNWTYSGNEGSGQIGHSDRDTRGLSISWNSAHQTLGCSPAKLEATGGAGLFYCFATRLPPTQVSATVGSGEEPRPIKVDPLRPGRRYGGSHQGRERDDACTPSTTPVNPPALAVDSTEPSCTAPTGLQTPRRSGS